MRSFFSRLAALFVLILLVLLVIAPLDAFAQDTTVTIPYGSWIEQSGQVIGAIILAAIAWLMRKLPASIVDILKTMKAEQLLAKAVDYGINAATGATKDKALNFNVGNSVVAEGVQYAIDNGPGWLIKWMGGEEALAAKIIARLNLDANTGVVRTPQGVVRLYGKA